ncbi:MAG: NADP-dependent malic enzyme, partial [Kiritimatiellia bacterium]
VAALYPGEELLFGPKYLIPKPFDRRLFVEVSFAVAEAAVQSGVGDPAKLQGYRERLEERDQRRLLYAKPNGSVTPARRD